MTLLRVSLFQTLKVTTGEGGSLDLGSPTTRSLFAYLLLTRDRPTDRRRLASLFWPRGTDSAARRNLRQYVHHIRRAFEPVTLDGDVLLADNSSLQINPQIPVWLDVQAFQQGTRPEATLPELQEALALYTGDLLEDIYEDWCDEMRGKLRQTYLNGLDRMTQALQTSGHFEEAVDFAHKWTSAEPLDEAAHRRLMALYALAGDRHRALQNYHGLVEALKSELDADPLPDTQALYHAIQSGALHPNQTTPIPVAPPRPVAPPPLPLVGRQNELALLEKALQSAQDGRGRCVLFTGESGIGKTRLLQEYLERHPGLPVLRASCHELESMVSYAPLRQALQSVPDLLPDPPEDPAPGWLIVLAPLVPALAQRLDHASGMNATAFASISDRVPVTHALDSLFLDLTARIEPKREALHLILDDLHWGDGPTWEFLAHLARRSAAAPLLIFGLCRLEDLPPERGLLIRTLERNDLLVRVPLHRLSPEETLALAKLLLPDQKPDVMLLNRLYQETEGNPFFIIETVRAMRESGRASPASLVQVPLSIQQLIEDRLDRLAAAHRELLATAAAVGRGFSSSLLQAITQSAAEDIVDAIEACLQRGLISEEAESYDFSHEKIRQVAYASLSRARREYIHRRIAEVLRHAFPPADAATLAHHYARSDQPLRALPYLTQAGEQALRVRSYHEARQFGLQAVNLLGRVPGPHQRGERIDLNLQLAQAYAFSGDLRRALEIISETERLAVGLGDEVRLGNVFYRSSQIFWLRGQPDAAADYARRTLRSAEEMNDQRLLYAALRMLGRAGIALSAYDDAIAYLVRYANLGKNSRPPQLSIVHGYLGVAYARVGSWARALEAARRGQALAEAENSQEAIAFARLQIGFVYADRRDWKACLETLAPMPDPLRPDEPLTPLGFMLLGLRGGALGQLGQTQTGVQMIRTALTWAEQTDYRVFHYLPRLYLADCHLLAGEVDAAQAEAGRALTQARAASNHWATAVALRILAETLTRRLAPEWSRVEDHLIEAMRLLRQVRARPDLARTFLALRRLYDRAGQIAWAVDCHFRAVTIFEELGMTEELRQAQGQAAGDRRGAVVIPDMHLRGPNEPEER